MLPMSSKTGINDDYINKQFIKELLWNLESDCTNHYPQWGQWVTTLFWKWIYGETNPLYGHGTNALSTCKIGYTNEQVSTSQIETTVGRFPNVSGNSG